MSKLHNCEDESTTEHLRVVIEKSIYGDRDEEHTAIWLLLKLADRIEAGEPEPTWPKLHSLVG